MATPMPAYGVPRISVVGDCFCAPYPVELVVRKKLHGCFGVRFEVLDINGSLIFQVDGCHKNIHKKRIMRDPAGFPILTMREKGLMRPRWTVHRGEVSTGSSDLIFSVQKSHFLQMKIKLDAFLASNINEYISNFQVVGSQPGNSYRVYRGDTVIAEVNHNWTWKSFCKSKESFQVKVYPGVDYAFITALIIILGESDFMICAA